MVPSPDAFAVTQRHRELLEPDALAALASPDRAFHPGLDLEQVFSVVAGSRDPTVFADGKALADSYPLHPLGEIGTAFVVASGKPGFDPANFWKEHFELPDYRMPASQPIGQPETELDEYISSMWDELTYHSPQDRGTLIGTPYRHLKPGGRFTEGYYWDLADGVSGLLEEAGKAPDAERQDKENLVVEVAGNLVYLIERFGYVPNGPRTYYLGRSQPPVFAGMVKEMSGYFGDRWPNLIEDYLPALTKEYEWWMRGEAEVAAHGAPAAAGRVVRLPDGAILNRHWDDNDSPRPESYEEDIRTAQLADGVDPRIVFRHLRAGAEGAKDFTARFMQDPERLETIHTTDFIPVELNSLLWEYEDLIAGAHDRAGRSVLAAEFHDRADRRQAAMNIYLWNESDGCYYDYDFMEDEQSDIKSMGMAYPVARGVAMPEQSVRVAEAMTTDLLRRGGFVSADITSPQQWDAPNGFARDQVEGVRALIASGPRARLAAAVAIDRWLRRDAEIYARYGVLVEKSDVVSSEARPGGGGEYPVQRGFLWTNGAHRVLEGMMSRAFV